MKNYKWDNVSPIPVKELLEASLIIELARRLVNQIEINDYYDSEGHDLKMNKAFRDLKKILEN